MVHSPGPRSEPPPVLVVLGLLCADEERQQRAIAELSDTWGDCDLFSEPVDFDHTPYYEQEMGPGLRRWFCTFRELVPPERLPALKWRAWQLEQQLGEDGRRRINLDPGYLDSTKVVLASFKPGPQKLYLGESVWADMVLYYRDGALQPLLWTFPDLRESRHLQWFTRARARYKELLRHLRAQE